MRTGGATDMFFDIIVLAIIGILTIAGLFSGMVKQLFGLVGVIGGYVLAMRYYQLCAKYLTTFHPGTARVISFVVIFLACIVLAHIIGWLIGRLFTISGLGFLNRIGGGLLGFVKGCLIVCVVVIILNAFFPANAGFYKGSYTIKYIHQVTGMSKKVSREEIRDTYEEKVGKGKGASPKRGDPGR
jgi:membrane protein required for colicin V production